MNKTSIEWTDYTVNPIKYRTAAGEVVWGCAKVSAGCQHCYAESLAHRYGRGGPFNAGVMAGLTPFIDDRALRLMLTYKPAAGKRCFVGDMTDIFGEWVPDELLDRLFAVFALRLDVTWQVLTKRPERMRSYVTAAGLRERLATAALTIAYYVDGRPEGGLLQDAFLLEEQWRRGLSWPLPNVWLGTSVEDQAAADVRILTLLQTPAAIRFISAEPLLGPISMRRRWLGVGADCDECQVRGVRVDEDGCCQSCGSDALWSGLDWVIVGGESGPGARPMHPDWARALRDQCRDAGVPFFFKQWGRLVPVYDRDIDDPDWRRADIEAKATPQGRWLNLVGGHGFHGDRVVRVSPVAKSIAGRHLDGSEWNEFPEVRA